jgi:hypothetical protein
LSEDGEIRSSTCSILRSKLLQEKGSTAENHSLTDMYTHNSHSASDWLVNAVAAEIWASVGKGAQALRLRTLQVSEFDVLVLSVTTAIYSKVTLRADLCKETRSEELELGLQ